MAERPILMNAAMVRAVLAGTKTQTRRPIKPHRGDDEFVLVDENNDGSWWPWRSDDGDSQMLSDGTEHRFDCPFGKPGDTLWVREAWRSTGDGGRCNDMPPRAMQAHEVWYEADGTPPTSECAGKLRPSLHMPHWASRLTLDITDIRVQRLQDISAEDAQAEGLTSMLQPPEWGGNTLYSYEGFGEWVPTARTAFHAMIDSIYPGAWSRNEWQWVISFRRIDARNKVTTS